jgi:hypothetical protein
MEERRAVQLERESHKRARELNQLKASIKIDEEARVSMQLHLNSLVEQVREAEKRRCEETAALRLENEQIVAGFREVEAEGASQQVIMMMFT